jgi:hypothetical protein
MKFDVKLEAEKMASKLGIGDDRHKAYILACLDLAYGKGKLDAGIEIREILKANR